MPMALIASIAVLHPTKKCPRYSRASNNDYRGSSLSRGHLAPAGAHKQSQEALDETFLLSDNIVPQEMSNNGSDWLRLERWAKGLCHSPEGGKGSSGDGSFTEVYVISGPLFLPNDPVAPSPTATSKRAGPIRKRVAYDVIGPHEVAVPSHLFKVVLAQRGTMLQAAAFPLRAAQRSGARASAVGRL